MTYRGLLLLASVLAAIGFVLSMPGMIFLFAATKLEEAVRFRQLLRVVDYSSLSDLRSRSTNA